MTVIIRCAFVMLAGSIMSPLMAQLKTDSPSAAGISKAQLDRAAQLLETEAHSGHLGAAAILVQHSLSDRIEEILPDLAAPPPALVHFGEGRRPAGFHSYEELLSSGADREPDVAITGGDPWTIM